jgi:hypothetical protein
VLVHAAEFGVLDAKAGVSSFCELPRRSVVGKAFCVPLGKERAIAPACKSTFPHFKRSAHHGAC